VANFRSLNAYIDESGDEGWRKVGQRARGAKDASSEWLILAAAISPAELDAKNMRIIDDLRVKTKRSQSHKPLKWRNLENDHFKKRLVADVLGEQRSLLYSVAALWKPALAEGAPGLRKPGYLYHLTGRYLIERLSWLAWESFGSARRQVNLLFESRQQTSYVDLEKYVRKIEADPDATIESGSIGHVRPVNPSIKGAQVADLVAGAVQDALEPNHRGDIETDYLLRLKNRLYCKQGRQLIKYGLKIFPPEALRESRYSWLADL
jgi:Protein of unknown function (DUF3800)